MKICMINDSWTPLWGGGPAHIWEVSNQLVRNYDYQIDVIVPVLTNPGSGSYPKIGNYLGGKLRIISVGKPSKFPNILGRLDFLFSALIYCLKNDYDIYHAQYVLPALITPLLKIIKGKKIAFTLHGKPVEMLGGGIINKLGLPKLFSFIVLKLIPYDIRFTAAKSSIDDKRYITVGNGVNVAEFDKVKVVKGDKFRIFWIGRKYDPVKGLKYLEEAVKGLDVTLDAAEGIYGEEKIKRFKMADLYVLPSLSEGFPIVLLEAMAAKLPIITTDVGDCRDLVEAAGCGVVIKSVNDLRPAIIKMMKSKDLKNMGERGYEYVKKNYTWNKVAAVYNSFYCNTNP